jgi:hypothetical protein
MQTHASGHEAGSLCPVMLRTVDDGITQNGKKGKEVQRQQQYKTRNNTRKQTYNYINF